VLRAVPAAKGEDDFLREARQIGKKGDITHRVASSGAAMAAELACVRGLREASMEVLKTLVEQTGGADAEYKTILNAG
jgi:hypothetical protein